MFTRAELFDLQSLRTPFAAIDSESILSAAERVNTWCHFCAESYVHESHSLDPYRRVSRRDTVRLFRSTSRPSSVRTSPPPDIIHKFSRGVFSMAAAGAENATQISRRGLVSLPVRFPACDRLSARFRRRATFLVERNRRLFAAGAKEEAGERGKKLEKRQKYQSACVHNHS